VFYGLANQPFHLRNPPKLRYAAKSFPASLFVATPPFAGFLGSPRHGNVSGFADKLS
jgi:hypothetical protein